jgi:hypothetical protein
MYHVVFSNVAPDPVRNYVSINALYSATRLGRGPAVPGGLAVLEQDREGGASTPWQPRRSEPHEYYLPILDVVGGRAGQHGGLGYMEVWDPKPIGGGGSVRQLLRTPAGPAIASASVPSSDGPTSDAGWVHFGFPNRVALGPGTDLALTATAAQPDSYEAFPVRKGAGYGFDSRTFFDGGYAQFNTGGGWVGWDQWGTQDQRISDLQFALDVAR